MDPRHTENFFPKNIPNTNGYGYGTHHPHSYSQPFMNNPRNIYQPQQQQQLQPPPQQSTVFLSFNKHYLNYFMRWSTIYPDLTVLSETCSRFMHVMKQDDPIIYNSFIKYLSFKNPTTSSTASSSSSSSTTTADPTDAAAVVKQTTKVETVQQDSKQRSTTEQNGINNNANKNTKKKKDIHDADAMFEGIDFKKIQEERPANVERIRKKDHTIITAREIEILNWIDFHVLWDRMNDPEKDAFFTFLNGLAQQAIIIRTCGSELKTVEGFASKLNQELVKNHKPGTKPDVKTLAPLALSMTLQNKDFVKKILRGFVKPEGFKERLESYSSLGIDFSVFENIMKKRMETEAAAEADLDSDGEEEEEGDEGEGEEEDEGEGEDKKEEEEDDGDESEDENAEEEEEEEEEEKEEKDGKEQKDKPENELKDRKQNKTEQHKTAINPEEFVENLFQNFSIVLHEEDSISRKHDMVLPPLPEDDNDQ